ANIDREGRDNEGKKFILECKTTGSYSGKEWEGDDIPLHYELQVLHYLIVTGYDYGYIACLIGNHKFVIKKVELDELIKNRIIEEETKFWQCVLNDEMPPVDSSEACTNILSEMYPVAKEESSIILTDDIDDLLEQRDSLKSQVKTLESQIDYIENYLKNELQDNESGETNNYRVTWKNVTSNRFDTKSFEKAYPELSAQFKKQSISRRFEVKKLKGDK
nr:YqaJ viral recombinase family protein [Candidatus Cloacimonadota bacterium]